jgi:hypothetical protein
MKTDSLGEHCCEEMQRHLVEGDLALRYIPKFREYGILILDGGSSMQEIRFCPWCGCALPPSLRDTWFEEVEALGLEPESPNLPANYRTDAWWKRRVAKASESNEVS